MNDVAATANAGTVTTNSGTAVNGTLSATLAYTGQTLTFAVVASPNHGSVSITNTATGAFTYTPASGYSGSDSFTFKTTDAYSTVSNTATESVTVNDVAATANNGSVTTSAGSAVNGTLSATLGYTGQTLTFAVVANPSHGSVTITNTATGAFTYTPTTGYAGSDSFTFKATDAYSTVSNTATESVTISDVAATANNATLDVPPNTSDTGTLSATLGYTGQTLTYAVVSGPSHGSVTITNTATGAFTYTPSTSYVGNDSFTFHVTDAYSSVSNTATETISVATPSLSPSSTSYTSRLIGTVSSAHNFTLTNNSSAIFSGFTISKGGTNPGQFTESDTCGTSLAGSASCTISVTFSPTIAGAKTASILVKDGNGNTLQTATLSGTALTATADITPSSSHSFGSQTAGTSSSPFNFTLTNNGTGTLTITSIVKAGTAFTESDTCGSTLASGAHCTISVTFSPGSTGAKTGTVTITDNATDGSSPQVINVSGTAI